MQTLEAKLSKTLRSLRSHAATGATTQAVRTQDLVDRFAALTDEMRGCGDTVETMFGTNEGDDRHRAWCAAEGIDRGFDPYDLFV